MTSLTPTILVLAGVGFLLSKVGMALATAGCNVRDQGQARVGIIGFSLLPSQLQKVFWNIVGNIFRRG
jgi:hypothetical protein